MSIDAKKNTLRILQEIAAAVRDPNTADGLAVRPIKNQKRGLEAGDLSSIGVSLEDMWDNKSVPLLQIRATRLTGDHTRKTITIDGIPCTEPWLMIHMDRNMISDVWMRYTIFPYASRVENPFNAAKTGMLLMFRARFYTIQAVQKEHGMDSGVMGQWNDENLERVKITEPMAFWWAL